jgi:hypothetical protein
MNTNTSCRVLFYMFQLLTLDSFSQTAVVEANIAPNRGEGPFRLEFRVTNASNDPHSGGVMVVYGRLTPRLPSP